MTNTQSVAGESNEQAKPAAEDNGAQEPSIDELLSQFEAAEPEPEQQPKSDLKADDIREVVDYVREDREARSRERTDADVDAAVKTVKGDLDLDDGLVKDFLHGRASTDERFLRAFQQRQTNPKGWADVQKALHRELASKIAPRVDQNVSDDVAAVNAAVRSQSTGSAEEPAPDFISMSDAELAAWEKKHIKPR